MIRSATSGFDRLDLERLWRWLFAALAASFIALTATGIWLTYRYEPIVGLQFDNIRGGRDITQSAMQYVHRWGAYTFVGLAAALLLVRSSASSALPVSMSRWRSGCSVARSRS